MLDTFVSFATTVDQPNTAVLVTTNLISIVIAVLGIIGLWATFNKAQLPGWAAIIPIFNVFVLMRLAGRPWWWLFLYIIPIVNIVIHILVSLDVARRFEKSAAFGIVGLWLFGFIGYLIVGFDRSFYRGDDEDRARGLGGYPAQPAV